MAAKRTRSKKRSAASSGSLPDPLVIFLDECLGGRIIAAELRKAGLDVRIQDEEGDVPRQLSDPEWAKLVASRGWVAITRDRHIRYRSAEKRAVAEAGLALFMLASRRNLSRADIIEHIGAAATKIPGFLRRHDPPFIAAIYRGGRIKIREFF